MEVVASDAHWLHDPHVELEKSRLGPPLENPRRAEAIRGALAADDRFRFVVPDEFGTAPIEAVHDPGLVRFLEAAWDEYQAAFGPTREVVPDVFAHDRLRAGMGPGREPTHIGGRLGYWAFETTTPIVEGTYAAARASVDIALSAAARVAAGQDAVYALCRPPGHHATSSLYGGYCFFNNAAIAAHWLTVTTAATVAVIDVDYHHGNGTQQIFYDRGDVLYVSLHGDPARAYPYSVGFADETGTGRGAGTTHNIPLPADLADDGYCAVLAAALDEVAAFGPEIVVVSLGLDTYAGDPICDLALSTGGLARCGALVAELALPTVIVQEGGYALDALGINAHAWLGGFVA